MPTGVKSVIFDCVNLYDDEAAGGVRSIEFLDSNDSVITLTEANGDFSASATSYYVEYYLPKYVFDTSLSKLGAIYKRSWLSGNFPEQRLIVVFTNPQDFSKIQVNNHHDNGTYTEDGVENVDIYTSENEVTNTTYGADTSNYTHLGSFVFDKHVEGDEVDNQIINLGPSKDPFELDVTFAAPSHTMTIEGKGMDSSFSSPVLTEFSADDHKYADVVRSVIIDIPNTDMAEIEQINFYDHKDNLIPMTDDDYVTYESSVYHANDYGAKYIADQTNTCSYGERYVAGYDSTEARVIIVFNAHQAIRRAVIDECGDGWGREHRWNEINLYWTETETTNTTVGADTEHYWLFKENVLPDPIDAGVDAYCQIEPKRIHSLDIDLPVPEPTCFLAADGIHVGTNRSFSDVQHLFTKDPAGTLSVKSVIFDLLDNYGDADRMSLGMIEFVDYDNNVLKILPGEDFDAYASSEFERILEDDPDGVVENAFDTSTSKSGCGYGDVWLTTDGNASEQRIICVFYELQNIKEIRVVNACESENDLFGEDKGVYRFRVHTSREEVTNTSFGADIDRYYNLRDGFTLQLKKNPEQGVVNEQVYDLQVEEETYTFNTNFTPAYVDITPADLVVPHVGIGDDALDAKTFVFDLHSNIGGCTDIGLRGIDFYDRRGNLIELSKSDVEVYDSDHGDDTQVDGCVFDTSLSKTGPGIYDSDDDVHRFWTGDWPDMGSGSARMLVVLPQKMDVGHIVVNNFHDEGGLTSCGVEDWTIRYAKQRYINTRYEHDTEVLSYYADSTLDAHVESDEVDDQKVEKDLSTFSQPTFYIIGNSPWLSTTFPTTQDLFGFSRHHYMNLGESTLQGVTLLFDFQLEQDDSGGAGQYCLELSKIRLYGESGQFNITKSDFAIQSYEVAPVKNTYSSGDCMLEISRQEMLENLFTTDSSEVVYGYISGDESLDYAGFHYVLEQNNIDYIQEHYVRVEITINNVTLQDIKRIEIDAKVARAVDIHAGSKLARTPGFDGSCDFPLKNRIIPDYFSTIVSESLDYPDDNQACIYDTYNDDPDWRCDAIADRTLTTNVLYPVTMERTHFSNPDFFNITGSCLIGEPLDLPYRPMDTHLRIGERHYYSEFGSILDSSFQGSDMTASRDGYVPGVDAKFSEPVWEISDRSDGDLLAEFAAPMLLNTANTFEGNPWPFELDAKCFEGSFIYDLDESFQAAQIYTMCFSYLPQYPFPSPIFTLKKDINTYELEHQGMMDIEPVKAIVLDIEEAHVDKVEYTDDASGEVLATVSRLNLGGIFFAFSHNDSDHAIRWKDNPFQDQIEEGDFIYWVDTGTSSRSDFCDFYDLQDEDKKDNPLRKIDPDSISVICNDGTNVPKEVFDIGRADNFYCNLGAEVIDAENLEGHVNSGDVNSVSFNEATKVRMIINFDEPIPINKIYLNKYKQVRYSPEYSDGVDYELMYYSEDWRESDFYAKTIRAYYSTEKYTNTVYQDPRDMLSKVNPDAALKSFDTIVTEPPTKDFTPEFDSIAKTNFWQLATPLPEGVYMSQAYFGSPMTLETRAGRYFWVDALFEKYTHFRLQGILGPNNIVDASFVPFADSLTLNALLGPANILDTYLHNILTAADLDAMLGPENAADLIAYNLNLATGEFASTLDDVFSNFQALINFVRTFALQKAFKGVKFEAEKGERFIRRFSDHIMGASGADLVASMSTAQDSSMGLDSSFDGPEMSSQEAASLRKVFDRLKIVSYTRRPMAFPRPSFYGSLRQAKPYRILKYREPG